MHDLILKPQEIPFDDPRSCCWFQPSPKKPFVATIGAVQKFGEAVILDCLRLLELEAFQRQGLDYLQVFIDPQTDRRLWFIEDGEGGAITALLPDDY